MGREMLLPIAGMGLGEHYSGFPKPSLFTVTVWVWSIWLSWDEMRWWGQIQSQSQSQRKPLFLLPPNILSSLSTTIPTKLCYFFNLSTLSLRSFFACCSLSLSGKCIAEVSFFSLGYLSVFFFLLSVELLNVICWV